MIQDIVTYQCPDCGSVDLVKNGHDYKGSQKYHCKNCNRYGTVQAQKGYSQSQQIQVKRAVLERSSLRGIARIFKMSRHTISRWLQIWLKQVPTISNSLLPAEVEDVLELDELWSFVGSKAEERWLWLALCRRTRQVVAYWVGDRSEYGALHLWQQIPDDYIHCASFSDRWQPYAHVFDLQRHRMVDKSEGQTTHVERWFNTLRQRLARFTRRTLAFSKRDNMHDGLLKMFIYNYNLSCIS